MISVQNHPRLLSGNKFALLVFGLLFFSACDLFRPVQDTTARDEEKPEEQLDPIGGGRVFNPETGEYETAEEVITEVLDTIVWREIPTSEYPAIVLDDETGDFGGGGGRIGTGEFGTEYLERYNVTLLLPFLTNRFNSVDASINANSNWAIQFYAGAKLAIEQLDKEGVNLSVNVFDTEANATKVNQIVNQNPAVRNSHLLLGTVQRNCAAKVANYAKEREIPFVSPYLASSGVVKENSFYIQTKPSLATHLRTITEHAKAKFSTDQIVIVTSDNENEIRMMQYLQQLNYELEGNAYAPRFQELVIKDDSPTLEGFNIKEVLRIGRETVFLFPSWEDKAFIYAFLRKAYSASQTHEITIYGMPQWQTFDNVDYNYFDRLKVHITSADYIDTYSPDVRSFKERFFDQYGTSPSSEAFNGYENMLYFGKMLSKHGTHFYEFFEQQQNELTTEKFNIQAVLPKNAKSEDSQYAPTIRYENRLLYLLRFQNYHFQLVE